jgi:hypothetical protein
MHKQEFLWIVRFIRINPRHIQHIIIFCTHISSCSERVSTYVACEWSAVSEQVGEMGAVVTVCYGGFERVSICPATLQPVTCNVNVNSNTVPFAFTFHSVSSKCGELSK